MAEKIKSDNEGRQKMILGTTNIDYLCLHGKGLPNEKRADLATSCRVRQQNLPSRANASSMSIKIRLSFRLLVKKNLSKETFIKSNTQPLCYNVIARNKPRLDLY